MQTGTINPLLRRLETHGIRITPQRKTLLKLFAETSSFLLPKDVYRHMATVYPGVSFDTIYRNIRVLKELGIVEQFDFEDGVKYKLGCSAGHRHDHHHHLICLGCNEVFPLMHCPMSLIEIPQSFRVTQHRFEVYGYCSECEQHAK